MKIDKKQYLHRQCEYKIYYYAAIIKEQEKKGSKKKNCSLHCVFSKTSLFLFVIEKVFFFFIFFVTF